jgi:hypothetical protein
MSREVAEGSRIREILPRTGLGVARGSAQQHKGTKHS